MAPAMNKAAKGDKNLTKNELADALANVKEVKKDMLDTSIGPNFGDCRHEYERKS